ncbi:MAG: tryptophan 7-halogenase [Candidatus Synoicihabitans palmerolidicus]|nr:tryptophan 7-halogenase [Candidatus Synoicihabitans palmerolidicus]
MCLKHFFPEQEVSVVESASIAVIGVGESTTPKLLRMLHTVWGYDLGVFYREVQPTWELGVRYYWGDEAYPSANNALGDISPFASLAAVGGE